MSKTQVYILLLLSLVMAGWILSIRQPMFVTEDGQDYLAYADAIYQGEWAQINSHSRFVLRSPLYPFLIAASRVAVGDPLDAVRGLHLGVAFLTLLALVVLLRGLLSPVLIVLSVALVMLQAGVFYYCVLSEWVAICLLLVVCAVVVRFAERPGLYPGILISLISSLAILLRSALVPLILVLPVLVFALPRARALGVVKITFVMIAAAASILPLLAYNWIVLAAPGPSPLGGIAVFGMSTLLPDKEVDSRLKGDALQFLLEFRELRYPREGADGQMFPVSREAIVNRNMFEVGDGIRASHEWDYVKLGEIGEEYAMAVISRNRTAYCALVIHEWVRSLKFIPLQGWLSLGLFVLCLGLGRSAFRTQPLIVAASTMLVFHLGHVLFCVLIHPAIYRHFSATYYPALGAMLLAVVGYWEKWLSSRSRFFRRYTSAESFS